MTVTLTLLDDTDSQGRNLWRLEHDYKYRIGPDCYVTVPKGYVTNFGTVPRFFYRLVTPAELREASIVHDWMCSEDFVEDGKKVDSGFSRWMADAVLWEAMGRMGIGHIRRFLVYYAVRAFAQVTRTK